MDANERRERATEEASQWWTRLGTRPPDEVTANDRNLFTQWLRESPLHVAEMLHVAHVHDALGRFKLWGEISSSASGQGADANVIALNADPDHASGSKSRHKRARRWGIAAAVAAVSIAAGWMATSPGGQVVATERAERREVMLNDGTVVQLEPETILRVSFEPHERHITLERGRALFRVAKDPRRPFWVRADQTIVRAVGTAFGVERKDQGIVVTVSEGKVAVTAAPSYGGSSEVAETSSFLTANQQITIPRTGSTKPARTVDTTRALAWAHGRLVFDAARLDDVIEEFNRYNHVQLLIDDPTLAQRSVSGVFQASDPETLLAFIRAGASVNVLRRGSQQILITPAP